MSKAEKDPAREDRITMEVVVDAYDEIERALGWYYYLDNNLSFPFSAGCICKRSISPLRPDDEVEVLKMAEEDECMHEMFVVIRREKEGLAVPLSQLQPSNAAPETIQAVEDWHYWCRQGYQF